MPEEKWEWLKDSEKLSNNLIKIRESVRRIYANGDATLPFYTPHGVKHCENVEKLIHKLIPDEKALALTGLTLRERFYLLASAWLHDLGMLPSLAEVLFLDKEYTVNEIRNIHHNISAEYITNKWKDVGIDENDREVLANLCRFHRKQEDINECSEIFTVHFGETIRLRLLAAYLRLADALDIGASRTSSEFYSICIAYDIPLEEKVHWIKNRLVQDVSILADEQKIEIIFREPWNVQDSSAGFKDKMDSIVRLVIADLWNELLPLVNVFARYSNLPIYLDISERRTSVAIDRQMQNDLREFVTNYEVMTDPSASKLVEMILISTANILGYSLSKNGAKTKMPGVREPDDNIRKKLNNFLDILQEGPAKSRPCHLGLSRIVNKLWGLKDEPIDEIADNVSMALKAHHESRIKIRNNSESFFNNKFLKEFKELQCINILLYGYSELVTKAICGFRDALMKDKNPNIEPRKLRNSDVEMDFSKKINLFICEAQPKTLTSLNDRLIYHDGSQYALHLTQHNFKNIVMIPDAIAGHVIEDQSLPIHFVIVGANGLTDTHFRHSAGHSSVINLARGYRNRQEGLQFPYIVLVVPKEKYLSTSCVTMESASSCPFENMGIHPSIVDGSFFLKRENTSMRESVWLLKDKGLMEKLFVNAIFFYNPREDVIPIMHIDYLISDYGYIDILNKSINNSDTIIKEHFVEIS